MENKFEKIIMGSFVIFVLIVGLMFFFQQRAIDQIKSQISGKNIGLAENSVNSGFNKIPGLDAQKYFAGEIKSVAADSLSVEAILQKPKDSKNFATGTPANTKMDDFEIITKTERVLLNDKTSFVNLKKEDLKAGDEIFITADNSPFDVDSLTALKIAPFNDR